MRYLLVSILLLGVLAVPSRLFSHSPSDASGATVATLPGDVDFSGSISTTDIIVLVNYLFRGGSLPAQPCVANVNADLAVTIADIIYMVDFVFRQGPGLHDACTTPNSDFWPLEQGNYWVYACNSQHPWCTGAPIFRSDVSLRDGDTAVLIRSYMLSTFRDTLRLRISNPTVDIRHPDSLWSPYYHFANGAFWMHADPFVCDDSIPYRAVLETAPVVTPAGTFYGCLRIEPMQKKCADAGTLREWWAPGVGMVRWQSDNFAGTVDYVLAEFHTP